MKLNKILSIATCSLLLPLAAAQVVPDECTLSIKTPSLSDVRTLKLKLDNGLQAVLISDPGAPESAAALAVEAGSWFDPPARHGLAHFIEHLLFLGSTTYPDEEGFKRYVDDHGGQVNAYTAETHTAFIFSIDHSGLEGALERFSHFFIDPLFSPDALTRERRAVDSEFQRTIENDDRRQWMVLKALGNREHPFSRFTAGNQLTLETATSDEARAWYESHYSSHLMHLVVLSALPLEMLQAQVEAVFEQIPRREVEQPSLPQAQLSNESKGSFVSVTPHQQRRQLSLIWELPFDSQREQEVHAGELAAFVLGHEGEKSLLAQLKREGLAEGIQCSPFQSHLASSYLFVLDIDLTEKGLAETDEVISRAFQAIKGVQASGIPAYVFEEVRTMKRLTYEYQTRRSPYDFVSDYVGLLIDEELSTFPSRSLVPERFDSSAIQEVLLALTPQNCLMMITATPGKTGLKPIYKEKWLGVPYTAERLDEERLVSFAEISPHFDISLPPPNPFLPKEVAPRAAPELQLGIPKPQLIEDNDWGFLFLAKDEQYFTPEIAWRFRVRSGAVKPADAESAVLLDLMVQSISEKLAPVSYPAALAKLGFHLGAIRDGIEIGVDGFGEKAPILFEYLLAAFTDGFPTSDEFECYKDRLRLQYLNAAKKEPVVQALAIVRDVLREDNVTDAQKAKAIRSIDYQQLLLFFDAFRSKTYVEGILFGDMSTSEAAKVATLFRTRLQKSPFRIKEHTEPKVLSLPKEKGPFLVVKKSSVNGNGIILLIDQGDFTFKRRAVQQILATGLETPFFQELRTKQQTGYVVKSWDQDVERHLFSFFAVQSNTYDGQELLARFELFIQQFLGELETRSFGKERFHSIKRALITQLEQPPKNPREMGDLLASLAFDHEANFSWIEERVRALRSLSYEEFTELSMQMLGRNNKQRLAVLVEGRVDDPANLTYRRVRTPDRVKEISNYLGKPLVVASRDS